MAPIVLDVGQCDMDHGSIKRLLEPFGARVLRAHTEAEAMALLDTESVDLVLVNRILDHDATEGLDVIAKVVARGGPKVMLVSNYSEYQQRAVQLGALEGFGKGHLRAAGTAALLKAVLV